MKMAYYDDAPKKKNRTNYAEKGSWEEEGSKYRNGGRKNSSRDGRPFRSGNDRKKAVMGSDERGGRSVRMRDHQEKRPGDRTAPAEPRRSFRNDQAEISAGRDRTFRIQPIERSGRYAAPAETEPYEPAELRTSGYQDFEYHRISGERTDEQDYILYGRNPIREALRSGRGIEKLLVQKGELSGSAREIVQAARERKIMVQEADKRRMDAIAPHHQGLIAFAEAFEYSTVEAILAAADERKEAPFIVLLDGVTDPHNLGAIIRTAECAGAHGVIIPQHRSVGLTPAAVKASAGAVEHILVARVLNLHRTIDELKKAGVWVYAMTMNGKDYEKVDFRGGTALVIGAEGEGISRLTAEKCDLAVSLPMLGKLDSLNASVAAGVVMYRVLSCRRSRE